MVTSMFQITKWRRDVLPSLRILDAITLSFPLTSFWLKLSLLAIAATEARSCLYFSRQLSQKCYYMEEKENKHWDTVCRLRQPKQKQSPLYKV